jgi:hypothetical protein
LAALAACAALVALVALVALAAFAAFAAVAAVAALVACAVREAQARSDSLSESLFPRRSLHQVEVETVCLHFHLVLHTLRWPSKVAKKLAQPPK